MLLKLEATPSGQSEVQEDLLLHLDEGASDNEVGSAAIPGLDLVDALGLLGARVSESRHDSLDEDFRRLEVGVHPEACHPLHEPLVQVLSASLRLLCTLL